LAGLRPNAGIYGVFARILWTKRTDVFNETARGLAADGQRIAGQVEGKMVHCASDYTSCRSLNI
jgi:hypothetical protein